MSLTQPAWGPPAPPAVLPVVPRRYHEFWRAPACRWWRGLLALLMGGGLWFAVTMLLGTVAVAVDLATGTTTMADYADLNKVKVTPVLFLTNNLSLAAAIPIALLTSWACVRQRPGWLSSVAGRFRWRWLLTCLLWGLPPYLLLLGIGLLAESGSFAWNSNSLFMIVTILLTTPLQSAGEEYLVRGLLARAVGSWFSRTLGLVLSAAVSAAVFMSLHVAQDIWAWRPRWRST